ncbi:hypothetical protein KOW79_018438 [Hemibagrus wyckioides]|uniref:Uncharacterized protein n=1 Tax=Hemibagrus wyckioides TaxID=337641 RepID=A0A9D3N983_9TELE|nr:hypothetical protein KOW79_018438 [Hemibagrus wyckioides]
MGYCSSVYSSDTTTPSDQSEASRQDDFMQSQTHQNTQTTPRSSAQPPAPARCTAAATATPQDISQAAAIWRDRREAYIIQERMKMTAEMSSAPVVSRRRVRRILYPAGARRVPPKEDKDLTRRWLLLLSAVLFLQIYTEDGRWDGPSAEEAAGQGDILAERHRDTPEGDTQPQPCGLNMHMHTHTQQPKCSQ